MPSIPRAVQIILEDPLAVLDAGERPFEYAKPAFAWLLDAGTRLSTSAMAQARPIFQTTVEVGKNASAAAFVHVDPTLSHFPNIKEMMANLIRDLPSSLPAVLEAGNRVAHHILPFILALRDVAWERIRQHPLISGLVTLYALLGLMLGPIWPLSVLLWLVGFGVKGVVLGSRAAMWQASIGNVVARSLFAILQALGARFGL